MGTEMAGNAGSHHVSTHKDSVKFDRTEVPAPPVRRPPSGLQDMMHGWGARGPTCTKCSPLKAAGVASSTAMRWAASSHSAPRPASNSAARSATVEPHAASAYGTGGAPLKPSLSSG